ncbi:MAG: hypothetical protein DLM52_03510 [Chthoniobacterales bacterium]|nr:MAG: hypothetical protein DLM52_03510 [Chthoniobacterales bacterium]
MKTTLKNLSRAGAAGQNAFPLIDCEYHSATFPNFRGGCAQRTVPSFRNISREYFRNEARGEFRLESMAFAAIVVTAAIPVLNNVHALADVLRAIGHL